MYKESLNVPVVSSHTCVSLYEETKEVCQREYGFLIGSHVRPYTFIVFYQFYMLWKNKLFLYYKSVNYVYCKSRNSLRIEGLLIINEVKSYGFFLQICHI